MGILNKTLIVTDIENYKSSDATFKSGINATGIDPIRNYFGFHHTERLAVYGDRLLDPTYNPQPGYSLRFTVEENMDAHQRHGGVHHSQRADARGGAEDLMLSIEPPEPGQR